MKKAISLAVISLALTTSTQAQCFTLRESTSNSVIKCYPNPSDWLTGWFTANIYPINTRIITWNSPVPVESRYQVLGWGYDSPATPNRNEAAEVIELKNQLTPAHYSATMTDRFSECDVTWMSSYQTAHLREFVMIVTLYKPGTSQIINQGYMRWSR